MSNNLQFKIIFCDNNPDVIDSLNRVFSDKSNVNFITGDILNYARGTLFSPANSSGFMDGGVDHDYVRFFGLGLQKKVHLAVNRRAEGYLPVGAAALIETGHELIPRLILAPTMSEPSVIPAYNIFRSFRAALKMFHELNLNGDIYTPGFGTGVGGVDPEDAAKMMYEAYKSMANT